MAELFYVEKPSEALKLAHRLGIDAVIRPAEQAQTQRRLNGGESMVCTIEAFNGDIRYPRDTKVLLSPLLEKNRRRKIEIRATLCGARQPTRAEVANFGALMRDLERENPVRKDREAAAAHQKPPKPQPATQYTSAAAAPTFP